MGRFGSTSVAFVSLRSRRVSLTQPLIPTATRVCIEGHLQSVTWSIEAPASPCNSTDFETLVFDMVAAADIRGRSDVVLWAACCTGFFGCFGQGFTSSAQDEPSLTASDVSVDLHSSPSFVSLHLCHSNTDTFGVGVRISLGRIDGPICPVKLLLSCLAVRGSAPGHLFQFHDGSPLLHRRLVEAVRHALEAQGLDACQFNGHSFRIGAATTATACSLEDSLIQTLGHWRSSAFTRYIRTPQSTLVAVSLALLSSSL